MQTKITPIEALELVRKYNHESFHIQHALTVGKVMRSFALSEGFSDEADFWEVVGLLHDIDFEEFPDEHCVKAESILRDEGIEHEVIHAVCSHGFGGTHTPHEPQHTMEKILFATDELTGLIGAAALMRPSLSCQDMELKSLKKKFKDKKFAAGCSREVITQGAELLNWDISELLEKTLDAMKTTEDEIAQLMQADTH